MFASSDRKAFARKMLVRHIEPEVANRKKISMPSDGDWLCQFTINFYSMWFSGRFCKISSEQTITGGAYATEYWIWAVHWFSGTDDW